MIFCDTSAAVKIYVPERESNAVRLILDAEDSIFLSEMTRVELMAVFHRRLREGQWNQSQFFGAVRQFSHDDLSGFWTWLPLDRSVLEEAAQIYTTLPDTIFLRSSDCIHLVTAMRHNFEEIHTFDRHQSAAAAALGLKAISVP